MTTKKTNSSETKAKKKVELSSKVKKNTKSTNIKKNTKPKDSVVKPTKKSVSKDKVSSKTSATTKKKTAVSNKKLTKKDCLKVSKENYYATGKRKTSIARVWVFKGSGNLSVNKKEGLDYFMGNKRLLKESLTPLSFLKLKDQFDVVVRVKGGGLSGQASSIKAGVAKAIAKQGLEEAKLLKKEGFLTRDARIKERKHYGHKRARKSFQFSKR